MARLNRAAFSPDDVKDAKRGYPDFDLRDYASSHGMEFLDHGTPGGFRAALPCNEELQSNVLRGTLAGGEYGIVAHEGLDVGWWIDTPAWGGSFYGLRVVSRYGQETSVRAPCTVAGVRVAEAAAAHPYMRLDKRRTAPPFSFDNRTKLDALLGVKGWSLWCEPKPQRETVERLVAEPVAELLRDHEEDGLFQAVVWWGTLAVRRNGFLRPDGIDELGRAAGLIARRLRDVCRPLAEPQPFDVELPPPPSEARDLPPGFQPGEVWREWALESAGRHGLELENPVAYHRAFPSAPVPGTAYVVLRGEIPHVGRGRLLVQRERDAVRPAVLVAAPHGSRATPPGGLVFGEHGARLEVADGLLSVWPTTSWSGYSMLEHIDEFCAAAAAVIGEARRARAAL